MYHTYASNLMRFFSVINISHGSNTATSDEVPNAIRSNRAAPTLEVACPTDCVKLSNFSSNSSLIGGTPGYNEWNIESGGASSATTSHRNEVHLVQLSNTLRFK
ncbi:hypothetical protein J6590_006111 [Homalodisca vitripennis]|nr:hypothetical protein J6590_006111 [Homalodisca vitripennis]